MTLANDSILVTPGTGATVATHTISAKEHQAIVNVTQGGHIFGTCPTWTAATGATAHVAAARTTLIDLFNASGSGVVLRVCAIYVMPALAAVTGVGQTYEAIRTSAVGTGGTTITPASFDTTNTSLPAQVTARTKPSGGATTATTLLFLNGSSEETSSYATSASILNHIPRCGRGESQDIILREGEGLKIDQTTSSSVGNVNVLLLFIVD